MKNSWRQKLANFIMPDPDYNEKCIPDENIYNILSVGIVLRIHRANSGFVVEVRNYDSSTNLETGSIYIITDDQNLGEELGKILLVNRLKS